MTVVFTNRYIRVDIDHDAAVIRYVRSAEPYASMDDLERSHEDLGAALDHLGRDRYGLLVDVRQAIGNQSPEFERAMSRARKILYRGFPRIAAVVKTAAGVLQLQRHAREDGVDMYVLRDEETARLFLRPLGALDGDLRDNGPKSTPGPPSGGSRSSRMAPPTIPPRSSRMAPPTIPPRSSRMAPPSVPPRSSRTPPPSIPPRSSRTPQSIPPRSAPTAPTGVPPRISHARPPSTPPPPSGPPASSPQPASSTGHRRR